MKHYTRNKLKSLLNNNNTILWHLRCDILRFIFSKRFVRLNHFYLVLYGFPICYLFYLYETPYFTEMRKQRLYLKFVEAPRIYGELYEQDEQTQEEKFLISQHYQAKEFPR